MKYLSWSHAQFLAFKKRYELAVKKEQLAFIFESDEFLTAYAKYLIEYLEPQFKV
jgi:hypothetical protein